MWRTTTWFLVLVVVGRVSAQCNPDQSTTLLPNNTTRIFAQDEFLQNAPSISFPCPGVDIVAFRPILWIHVVGTGHIMQTTTCDPATTEGYGMLVVACPTMADYDCIGAGTIETCGGPMLVPASSATWRSVVGLDYYIGLGTDGVGLVGGDSSSVGVRISQQDDTRCANAQPIVNDGSTVTTGSLTATTNIIYGPNCEDASSGIPDADPFHPEAPGKWYTVQGTGGPLLASTCGDDTNVATMVTVYQGSCPSLDCVATSGLLYEGSWSLGASFSAARDLDCLASSFASRVLWQSTHGETYWVVVSRGSSGDNTPGNFDLIVRDYIPNDRCDGATTVVVDPSSTAQVTAKFVVGDGFQASSYEAEFGMPRSCRPALAGDDTPTMGVWFKLVGTEGNRIRVTNCDLERFNQPGNLALYKGSDCDSLECLDVDVVDNACDDFSFDAEEGETYYLYIFGIVGVTETMADVKVSSARGWLVGKVLFLSSTLILILLG